MPDTSKSVFAPEPGFQLIEASAGTGKTYTITNQYLFLLLEIGLHVDEILVVTFTKAATAELKDRIRSRLRSVRDFLAAGNWTGLDDERVRAFLDMIVAREGGTESPVRRLDVALGGFDEAAIYTIHGFCQRVLGEQAFLSGYNLEFDVAEDELPILETVVGDFARSRLSKISDAGYRTFIESSRLINIENASEWNTAGRLLNQTQMQTLLRLVGNPFISFLPEESNDPGILLTRELIDFARTELPRRKKEAGVTSFSDMLLGVLETLSGPNRKRLSGELSNAFKAALIDEFQDTDAVQYEIIRRIYEGSNRPVVFVGDPKQAIYSFRGGDIFTYFAATSHLEEGRKRTLTENFRSSQQLVDAVTNIFRYLKSDDPFKDGKKTQFPSVTARFAAGKNPRDLPPAANRSAMHWLLLPDDEPVKKERAFALSIQATVVEVRNLLRSTENLKPDAKRLIPGDIAILVRTNGHAHLIQEALLHEGIPSVVKSQEDVYSTPEAGELLAILRAIGAPQRESELGAGLLTSLMQYDAPALNRIKEDHTAIESVTGELLRLRAVWTGHRNGFILMARELLYHSTLPAEGRTAVEWIATLNRSERILTNVLHLIELLHQESLVHPGVDHLLGWLERKITGAGEGATEFALRLESDEDRVQVLTIHSSKGLEYPVVFLPFAWDGMGITNKKKGINVFHSTPRTTASKNTSDVKVYANLAPKVEKGVDEPFELYKREEISEHIRLLYVAVTRARQRCYLTWGFANKLFDAALAELFFPEQEMGSGTKALNALGREGSIAPVKALVQTARGGMSLSVIEEQSSTSATMGSPVSASTRVVQDARIFGRRTVTRSWESASYTSLTKQQSVTARDRDASAAEWSKERLAETSIFSFPAGARTGIAWHELFEQMNFQADENEITHVASEILWRHNIESRFESSLTAMLKAALEAPLTPDGHCLRGIPSSRSLREFEFMFSMDRLSMNGLRSILADPMNEFPFEYRERASTLQSRDISGYMTGAIDLLFESDGKFFIVDYKSNLLGVSPEDYATDRLRATMALEHYYLQYLIYVVAVHRYLGQRVPGYAYEKHFGGVAYMFLRGIRSGESGGIMFERPAQQLIQAIDAQLITKVMP